MGFSMLRASYRWCAILAHTRAGVSLPERALDVCDTYLLWAPVRVHPCMSLHGACVHGYAQRWLQADGGGP